MKTAYIAHPFRGMPPYSNDKCRKNSALVTEICLAISRDYTSVAPISPIHAFSFFPDALKCNNALVMDYCHKLLEGCDDLWVFGDWASSSGCLAEIGAFTRRGVGSVYFCEFHEKTGQIASKACFSLGKPNGKDDLIDYVLAEHKKRNEAA